VIRDGEGDDLLLGNLGDDVLLGGAGEGNRTSNLRFANPIQTNLTRPTTSYPKEKAENPKNHPLDGLRWIGLFL
jgi:hypothetical protein